MNELAQELQEIKQEDFRFRTLMRSKEKKEEEREERESEEEEKKVEEHAESEHEDLVRIARLLE